MKASKCIKLCNRAQKVKDKANIQAFKDQMMDKPWVLHPKDAIGFTIDKNTIAPSVAGWVKVDDSMLASIDKLKNHWWIKLNAFVNRLFKNNKP